MKLGILTNYHLEQFGGAEEALDRIARHWHHLGHEVVLFASRARRGTATRAWSPPYRVVRIPRPFSTRHGLSIYRWLLEWEARRGAFDALIGSDAYWPGYVTWQYFRRHGTPYVLYSHGGDLNDRSRFLKRALCRRRIAQALTEAAGIACISRYLEARIAHLAVPEGTVRIIPNGWPDDWTDGQPPRYWNADYLFAIGRLVELKGFQTLIAAYARFAPQFPSLGLVIAGNGSYQNELCQLAASLGLRVVRGSAAPRTAGSVVWFPGFVEGEIKRSLAAHAAVGVCPSIVDEALGIVIVEMLALGTPVVATRRGGIVDLVQSGINGDLFEAGDCGDLAGKLEGLLANPTRLERLRAAAAHSVSHLRWSQVAEAHLELIRDVLGSQPRGAACPVPLEGVCNRAVAADTI